MAKKDIPSHNKDQQLEALRPGLTDDVADPAAAKDSVNEGAVRLHHKHQDYQPKYPPSARKA